MGSGNSKRDGDAAPLKQLMRRFKGGRNKPEVQTSVPRKIEKPADSPLDAVVSEAQASAKLPTPPPSGRAAAVVPSVFGDNRGSSRHSAVPPPKRGSSPVPSTPAESSESADTQLSKPNSSEEAIPPIHSPAITTLVLLPDEGPRDYGLEKKSSRSPSPSKEAPSTATSDPSSPPPKANPQAARVNDPLRSRLTGRELFYDALCRFKATYAPEGEARPDTSASALSGQVPAHSLGERWEKPFKPNYFAYSPALDRVQLTCQTDHKKLWTNSNKSCPIECAVCHADDPGKYHTCANCYLRICTNCRSELNRGGVAWLRGRLRRLLKDMPEEKKKNLYLHDKRGIEWL
ncbi:hypothetical protein K470DRAFT_260782 [Piedraia hortae CBS 480.64]|uniref:Uncharacterized protein n=1 Tax=Piedraia hortae CBS 480.64 TaxID=1314780 RepID=A0A6A7BQW1_9PEZI|nr:hypothetical protein K470DRAFT_260782 [Piedraia hortae CBS 480.64]